MPRKKIPGAKEERIRRNNERVKNTIDKLRFYVNDSSHDVLVKLAAEKGKSVSTLCKEAIEEYYGIDLS